MENINMKIIAKIQSDFGSKFGVPRQAGLAPALISRIIFEPEYRNADALRGLEGFSHIWLIWQFSEAIREDWSPTVRPPRLGGNERMGVFATRSPFRPNPIGLSCVELLGMENTVEGPILTVGGADLMNGTPIYDIKPYIPYADAWPEAKAGWTAQAVSRKMKVEFQGEAEKNAKSFFDQAQLQALIQVLAQDPRPRYQTDPERIYGMDFAGKNVKFICEGDLIKVTELC